MKSLKQLCIPRDSVFDVSKRDTVLNLSHLSNGKIDAKAFFEENYVTDGMKTLLANETRLKNASDFKDREMGGLAGGFGASLVRHALFAAYKCGTTDGTRDSLVWLKTEVPGYAASRRHILEILEFLAALEANASMSHWHKDGHAAGLVAGALRNREDNV